MLLINFDDELKEVLDTLISGLLPHENFDKEYFVDIYENNAYDIQMELRYAHPELKLDVRIASTRDGENIDALFNEFRP